MIVTPPSRARKSLAPGLALLVAAGLVACSVETTPPKKEEPQLGPLATDVPAQTSAPAATSRPRRAPPAGTGAETWNAAQIDWQPFEAGLAKAKADKKPICLVIYTTWCPHCRNYSKVFDDARVVERAKSFVMIRIDADQEEAVATRFAKDGSYIPRTFFLAPDGTADFDIHPARPKYIYFYNENDPGALLGGMDEALKKHAR